MSKVDLELKKAFTELQEKQADTAQKIRVADLQIENHKRNKLHASYIQMELSPLDRSTRTYESVGRMFVLTPIEKIEDSLKQKQISAEEKVKLLENNKTYLLNSLSEATDSLRELVQQKKES